MVGYAGFEDPNVVKSPRGLALLMTVDEDIVPAVLE